MAVFGFLFDLGGGPLGDHAFLLKRGQGFVPREVELEDRENILRCPIEGESAGVVVAEDQKNDRHEVEDTLLHGISGFWCYDHLPDHCACHDDGQNIDRKSEEMGDGVWLGEVCDPEERAVTKLDGGAEHRVETEKDRNLDEHGQAAAERIHPILFVELHGLLVELLRVVFVFVPHLGHLRREKCHLAHFVCCLVLNRPENGFDQNGQDDNGCGVVAEDGVEVIHRPEQEFAHEPKNAKAHDLILCGPNLAQTRNFLGA